MARTTQKVEEVRELLRGRLLDGRLKPGDQFLSGRAIANTFGVSYQTADRLLTELVKEGLIVRRRGSGSFLIGEKELFQGAQIFLPFRAQRAGSLGSVLQKELSRCFRRARIPFKTEILPRTGEFGGCQKPWYPLVWECQGVAAELVRSETRGLMLYDHPQPGLEWVLMDSVSVDDYSGGVMAGQILAPRLSARERVVVLAGPESDHRSTPRTLGFLSVVGGQVVGAEGWYLEDGLRAASAVMAQQPAAVFCGNDRLAEGVALWCRAEGREVPILVGFDGAPVSEHMGFSTIGVSWSTISAEAVRIVQRRLSDPDGPSIHAVVAPHPIRRGALAG